jgi:hypothetical protein
MSVDTGRLTSRNPRQLIHRILDQPNLVAAVQSLPPQALGKLIGHIGLEDAGELVALATTAQLEGVFDDDLWRSPSPGKDETFDADRFTLWLEVMLEAGEDFAAAKLAELPEDLVTLAFHKQVLVINIEEMAIGMSSRASENPVDDDVQIEKALESCLAEELGEYRIISRHHESWDILFGLLVTLDRDHHAFLQRLLERLCAMDAELVDDNGGLWRVLTSEESLESDVGADREDRRAEQGFLAPSSAAAFLTLARTSKLDDLVTSEQRDPITNAYFRHLGEPTANRDGASSSPKGAAQASPTSAPSDLLVLLREADVLPPARTENLLAGISSSDDEAGADLFTATLRQLAGEAPDVHASRVREVAYLANVLAVGCSLSRRAMRPVEAARAAVATCNLGLARTLTGSKRPSPALALKRTPADKLFRIGWNVLFHEVVSAAAATAEQLLTRFAAPPDLKRAAAALRSAVAAGKPWLALRSLDLLEQPIGQQASSTLAALMDECPRLTTKGSARAQAPLDFIATEDQLQTARGFLQGTLAFQDEPKARPQVG